jgi:hypothetical protein
MDTAVAQFALKLVTALAWLWGSLMAVGTLNAAIIGTDKSSKDAARMVLNGFPAWAWLLARYLL